MAVALPLTVASAFSVIAGTRNIIPTRANMTNNTPVCPLKSILKALFTLIQIPRNMFIWLPENHSIKNINIKVLQEL